MGEVQERGVPEDVIYLAVVKSFYTAERIFGKAKLRRWVQRVIASNPPQPAQPSGGQDIFDLDHANTTIALASFFVALCSLFLQVKGSRSEAETRAELLQRAEQEARALRLSLDRVGKSLEELTDLIVSEIRRHEADRRNELKQD